MRHKIVIGINEKNALEIQEHSELEDEQFFLVYKNIYNSDDIKSAIEEGDRALIDKLRNDKFFPSSDYMNQIMDVVKNIYAVNDENPFELSFDDQEFNIEEAVESKEDIEDEKDVETKKTVETKTPDDTTKKDDKIDEDKNDEIDELIGNDS